MASTDVARLANFQKHFEDMRALIHCKICLKPFYEPYTLPCGHTYCYSCFSNWCSGAHNRGRPKTCPDCRATITVQPSPNFLLRDLVQMFLTHTELLPEDETVEEHLEGKRAEVAIIASDKTGLGLFKGVFRRRGLPGFLGAPIIDVADGVTRCPHCAWELEDGECAQCGWGVDESLGSYNSDEGDRDISPIDDFRLHDGRPPIGAGLRRPPPDHRRLHMDFDHDLVDLNEVLDGSFEALHSSDDSVDDDEDEDNDEMNSFISDDEDEDLPDEVDEDDGSTRAVHRSPTPVFRRVNADPITHIIRQRPAPVFRRTNADVDERNDAVARGAFSPPPRHFYSIDLSEDSTGEDSAEGSSNDSTTITTDSQMSTEDTDSADSVSEQQTNYDTDSSVREVSPPVRAQLPRTSGARKRRIVSDEDSSDENRSIQSDDTARLPPQANSARMVHLRGQRRRRPNDVPGPSVPDGRRIMVPPDHEPPRQVGRRTGRGSHTESNAGPASRRGRLAMTRVH